MPQSVNIGKITADLELDSGNMERGIAGARNAIGTIKAELERLKKELAANEIGTFAYAAAVAKLDATQAALTAQMLRAHDALLMSGKATASGLGVVNAEAKALGASNFSRAGQGLMQLGYIADDLQYSFSACVNNIAPLIFGFTGSMGLAGAVQLGAVAVNVLATNWSNLMNAMGLGRVKTQAEQMEELGRNTHKTADETERLHKFEKARSDFASLIAEKPKEVQKDAEAAKEAITEAGSEKVRKGLSDVFANDARFEPSDAKKKEIKEAANQDNLWHPWRLAKGSAALHRDLDAATAKGIDAERASQVKAEVEKVMASAASGDADGIKNLMGVVKRNLGAFPKGLFGELENSLPENRRKQEEIDREGNVQAARMDREDKAAEKDKREDAADLKHRAGLAEHAFKKFRAERDAEEKEDKRLGRATADHGGKDMEDIRQGVMRDQVKEAKAAAPGIGKEAEARIVQGLGAGMTEADVLKKTQEAIFDQIKKSGAFRDDAGKFNDVAAGLAAEGIAKDARGDVRNEIVNRAFGGHAGGKEDVRHSETFEASQIGAKVQAAVSNVPNEQLATLNEMKALMVRHERERLAEKGIVTVKVKR